MVSPPIFFFFITKVWQQNYRRVGKYRTMLHSVVQLLSQLWPHRLQHARLLCPSQLPGVCSNSSPLSRWFCHPLLLPSVFASIRVFSNESARHIRWPKYWASASPSVLPMNILGWFPWWLTGLISLQSRGLSIVFSSTTVRKYQFLSVQPSLWYNSHIRIWLLEKP